MFKSLIAATLALALALPATTNPARADAEDAVKVIGGLVALYALKEALDNRRERRQAPVVTRQHTPPQATIRRSTPRHAQPHRDVRIIPSQCRRDVTLANGRTRTAYGARCMQNRVARPGTLPPSCIRQFQTPRGTRNVYGARCLQQNGWAERHARR